MFLLSESFGYAPCTATPANGDGLETQIMMEATQRPKRVEPIGERNYRALVVTAFVVSLSAILAMEYLVGSQLIGGTYFQEWTSDRMMQTSSAANLRADLSGTLWYLHKQPPGLDFVRGLLAKLQPGDQHLLRNLDVATYRVLAVFFALQTTIIVAWLFQLRGLGTALIGGLIWMLHPAPIMFATFLDGTFLSSLLFTWTAYELWRLHTSDRVSGVRVALAANLLVLTRTAFQWTFLPVTLLSVWLLSRSRRVVVTFAMISLATVGSWAVKQHHVFGLTTSSTFGGYHLCGAFWIYPKDVELEAAAKRLDIAYPTAANRYPDEFNTEKQHREHLTYTAVCQERILTDPLAAARALTWSVVQNLRVLMQPTSSYTRHVLVDRLPWRKVHDRVFSGTILFALVMSSATVWLMRRRHDPAAWPEWVLPAAALLIPWLYGFATIGLVGNRYEWVESQRLKFFLEPVTWVFIMSQYSLITASISRWWTERHSADLKK